jgi:Methylase involved in ubiquinone/menaquinone biosynthesis
VLDVATGTAAVARELVRQKDCYVVGIDQSAEMLEEGRRRVALAADAKKIRLLEGDARSLPFADGQFDALTFTYLLRYVEDPPATLRELARVVKPGGTIAGLEFGVPRGVWRPLWEFWVGVGLPGAGRVIGDGWDEVGSFLGPSIKRHYAEWPLPRLLDAWRSAGIADVQARRLSLGGGIVTVGTQGVSEPVAPAFYALRAGGWRDYVTLLHLPYTLWNLSYVASARRSRRTSTPTGSSSRSPRSSSRSASPRMRSTS